MRADAQKNYDAILVSAALVLAEQGVDASLRDIARRADVGLATLLRHFPSRDALLEALLRTGFTELAATAVELRESLDPKEALMAWLREFVGYADTYRGMVAAMAEAIDNPESALHAGCVQMRAAGAELLTRAQHAGAARSDLDADDLFLLAAGAAWTCSQAASPTRRQHLLEVQCGVLLK